MATLRHEHDMPEEWKNVGKPFRARAGFGGDNSEADMMQKQERTCQHPECNYKVTQNIVVNK